MWIVVRRTNGIEEYWGGWLWTTNKSIAKRYKHFHEAASIADDMDGYTEEV